MDICLFAFWSMRGTGDMAESKACDSEPARDWELICIPEWDWCRSSPSLLPYPWPEERNCRLLPTDPGFWSSESSRDTELGELLLFCDMIIDFEAESDTQVQLVIDFKLYEVLEIEPKIMIDFPNPAIYSRKPQLIWVLFFSTNDSEKYKLVIVATIKLVTSTQDFWCCWVWLMNPYC